MNKAQLKEWEIKHDPSRTDWLKTQVEATKALHPLLAYHEAAALFLLLGTRLEEQQSEPQPTQLCGA